MTGPVTDEGDQDSVGGLFASSDVADPLERHAVFEQVTQWLFSTPPAEVAVGRYALRERLGGGGQGVVYAGWDPKLERRVAIKILRAPTHEGRDRRQRLRREAMALAQLSHPNVIAINDVGTCDAGVFLVMQYVPGEPLSHWMDGQRSWREILEVFAAAGRGLEAAHARGIIHRDFKPSNVWLGEDGVVRLLDFGLAQLGEAPSTLSGAGRVARVDDPLTGDGTVLGTPAYMAPEQHEGRQLSPASDQYAWCVALYEALSGVRPFEGLTLETLATRKQLGQTRGRPSGSQVPSRVWRMLERGLRPDPFDRWPTMTAALRELDRCLHPRRATRAWWLGGVALATLAALSHGSRASNGSCDDEVALAEIWSDHRRERMLDAYAASSLVFARATADRIVQRVDRYAESWRQMRVDACARLEHDARADQTMRCLARLRAELADRIDLLDTATLGVVEHADEILGELVAPSTCAATRWEPKPELAALYASIGHARALGLGGRGEDALLAARAAFESADAIDDEGLRAEASLVYGQQLVNRRELDLGIEALERAYLLGIASGRDGIAYESALDLVNLFASARQDLTRCKDWLDRASATYGRLGTDDPVALGRMELARAKQAFSAGEHVRAVPHARQAADLLERAVDPRTPAAIVTLSQLLANTGDARGHEREASRAVAVASRSRGADHPATANAMIILAIARSQSDPEEARGLFERSLALLLAAYGEDDLRVAEVRRKMATFDMRLGRYEAAADAYRAVLAAQRAQLPEGDSLIAQTAYNLSQPLRMLGEREEATTLGREAVAIAESKIGADHPTTAIYLNGLGESIVDDEPRAALELFERASRIMADAVGEGHELHAVFRSSVGRAQLALGHVAQARETLDRAWSTMAAAERTDPTYRSAVLHRLALVEAAQGETVQSLARLEDALALLEGVRGANDASLAELLQAMADRYDELGDAAAAKAARKRAASLGGMLSVP